MKVKSECVNCGKTEMVSKKWVEKDANGYFHFCDKCMKASRQWSENRLTRKEIRQGK